MKNAIIIMFLAMFLIAACTTPQEQAPAPTAPDTPAVDTAPDTVAEVPADDSEQMGQAVEESSDFEEELDFSDLDDIDAELAGFDW